MNETLFPVDLGFPNHARLTRTRLPKCRPLHALLGLLALFHTQAARAADVADENWPQWRGPMATGVAPTGDPPTEWSETRNVKWKFKIPGDGDSTPIVWGDKIFLLSAVPAGQRAAAPLSGVTVFGQAVPPGGAGPRRAGGAGGGMGGPPPTEVHQWIVLCLDRRTGNLLWQKIAREEVPHEGHQQNNTFASYSPITDGQRLYAYFGSWGLYCYDFNGELKWQKDFGKLRSLLGFGEGGSPALYGDKLIINRDAQGPGFIAALSTKDGEILWKKERNEAATWCTPLVVPTDKGVQVVVAASGKTRGYDLANGDAVWECAGQARNVIPSPVAGHGMVFALSGYSGHSLQAIRYDRTGDLTGSDAVAWSLNRSTPYVPSPLLYDDMLYFLADNNAILSCYDAKSGKALIDAERLADLREVYASPVGAAGRVYIVGRDGTTMVIKKGPRLETLAVNKLDDRIDASPAVVGRELFLRGHQYLYCIAER